jgi:hypothetical protein
MRGLKGAGVVCSFISRGVMVYDGKVGLGLVGYMQGLWLGRNGGEMVGGVQEGALLGQEPKVWLQVGFLEVMTKIWQRSSPTPTNH